MRSTSAAHESYSSRGYLPHWDVPGAVQFLTWRLHDSLPQEVYDRLIRQAASKGEDVRPKQVEALLDKGYGQCLLARPMAAIAVQHVLFDDFPDISFTLFV
ncbi:MAG: hypothetical protein JST30_02760 [Armatimonadetes bacterium]|nr:hypothetical protein [Armatimonadota bacterium]